MITLNFPNAVREEHELHGRKRELDHILQILTMRPYVPILVQGERRVGKTSLLNVVISRLKKIDHPRYIPIEIEPRGITNLGEFAHRIFQRMCSLLEAPLSRTGLTRHDQVFHMEDPSQFEAAFLGALGGNTGLHFVLCVDEFDIIIQSAREDLSRIMGLLMLLGERSNLPLSLFLTMTRLPDDLKDSFPTPFTSIVEIVELPLFPPAVVHSMSEALLQGEASVSEEALAWLVQFGGGHPYFTKLLLDHLLKQYQLEAPMPAFSYALLGQAMQEAELDPRAAVAVENLYRVHFNRWEKEVILLLADQPNEPLARGDLQRAGGKWLSAAGELHRRSYLFREQDHFRLRIGFLGNWLRNWTEYEEEKERYPDLRSKLSAPPPIIEVDDRIRQLRVVGLVVPLSAQEYHILFVLAGRAGSLVPREELVDQVWGTAEGVTDQTIDTAFYRLRKKLGEAGIYLQTIPGQGFVLQRALLIGKGM